MRLMDYGFDNFRWHTAVPQGQSVGSIRLPDAAREQVPVRAGADLRCFIHRADADLVQISGRAEGRFDGRPCMVNDDVGEIVAYMGGQELGRVPALAAADVGPSQLFRAGLALAAGCLHRRGVGKRRCWSFDRPPKVNLTLDVVGRRADGYHFIRKRHADHRLERSTSR